MIKVDLILKSIIVEYNTSLFWGVDNCGLNMTWLAGKGFDGAFNMSGYISGVSARQEQLYPNAKYFTHCCLVIVARVFHTL